MTPTRTLHRLWKRLPGVDRARQIPSDDAHRRGQCGGERCPYVGWHRLIAYEYEKGHWCGECRFGVVEDPPCCTRPETVVGNVEEMGS